MGRKLKYKLKAMVFFLRADQRLLRPGVYRARKPNLRLERLYIGKRATLEFGGCVMTIGELHAKGTLRMKPNAASATTLSLRKSSTVGQLVITGPQTVCIGKSI